MRWLKLLNRKCGRNSLKLIVDTIQKGGIILCPTDTSYLIGADAKNELAIKKVYDLKGRNKSKPIHIIVANLKMAEKYATFNTQAEKLARHLFPGKISLILEKKSNLLSSNLTGGKPTIGIRIPNLKLNTDISKDLGGPYTATSANKSGQSNSYSVQEFLNQLSPAEVNLIDLVIDFGKLAKSKPSTIVDCTTISLRLLRSGPVSKNLIEKTLGSKID